MKVKAIRDYIDNKIESGYSIKLLFEESFCVEDYENCHLYVVGTSPIAIISCHMGYDIDITKFDKLFSGYHGLNPILVVSYTHDHENYRDEYTDVLESMNINTLEIKKLDIQIYQKPKVSLTRLINN